MRDSETLGEAEGEGSAVATSIVHFNDGKPNMELIGFSYFDTDPAEITWTWDSHVETQLITIPLSRIDMIETRFEATGDTQ